MISGPRRWALAGTAVALLGSALGFLVHKRFWRPSPGPTACQLFVQRCADHKRAAGPLQALLFCAETMGDLADVEPDDVPQVCGALLGVLERAPRVGWHRALRDAGFTRKASP